MDSEAIRKLGSRSLFVAPMVLALCWLFVRYDALAYLSIVVMILGLYGLALNRSWTAMPVVVLLHPVTVFTGIAAAGYAAGAPIMIADVTPGERFPYMHPRSRAVYAPAADYRFGRSLLRKKVHNGTLRALRRAFGPPRNTYTGSYPGPVEAMGQVWLSPVLPRASLLEDRIPLEDQIVELAPGLGATLLDCIERQRDTGGGDETDAALLVSAARHEDQCLIVRLFNKDAVDPVDCAALIDAETGKPFSFYAVDQKRVGPPFSYYDPPFAYAMARVVRTEGTALLEEFLEAGMDVNARGIGGRTPLEEATAAGREDLIALLNSRGASAFR